MVFPIGDLNPTHRVPVVTLLLIATNVAVFLLLQPHDGRCREASFLFEHAAVPDEVLTLQQLTPDEYRTVGMGDCPVRRKNVLLSVVSAMFLHASVWHLAGNMLFLWVFGNNVEDRLGRWRYLAFYGAGGVIATYAFALLHPGGLTPLLGASGAIAAVLGAYLVLFPHARVRVYAPFPVYLLLWLLAGRIRLLLVLFAIVEIPAFVALGFWFWGQLTSASSAIGAGVAVEAHIAGFLAGMAMVALWRRRLPARPSAA